MARQAASVTRPGVSVMAARSSAPPHPRVQRIEADAIDQLGRPLDVPDREVAPLAGFERADLVEPAERARRLARDAGEASSTVSRNSVAAMFMVSSSEVIGEVPGLLSVAIAIGTPWRRKASTGGSCFSRST